MGVNVMNEAAPDGTIFLPNTILDTNLLTILEMRRALPPLEFASNENRTQELCSGTAVISSGFDIQ